MDRLEPPSSYRFFTDQKNWLKRKAKEDGQSSEVVIIRRLIEQAMQSESKRTKPKTT